MERIELIKKELMNNHTVNISELSDKFNVTNQTIRRDLNQLESEGFINRTYGGAVLNEAKVDFAVPFYRRLSKNKDGKDKIALQVIPLLVNCNSIFADSSTTVVNAVKYLRDSDLTVVSNSAEVPRQLYTGSANFICSGGILDRHSISFHGAIAERTLKNYNVDVALISCKGLDMEQGVTDSTDSEAIIKKIMIKQASEVYLLVDSTKFDKKGFVHLIDASKLSNVITDKKPSVEWLEYFKQKNIKLIYPK